MQEIIKRGVSPKNIIKNFSTEHSIPIDCLKYVVEHKGSKGLFSLFGKKDSVVKFYLPEVEDIIKEYLKTLLGHLNVSYRKIDIKVDKNTYFTHVKGVDNPGFLIGKEGKMLSSIQHLLNKVIDDKDHKHDNVVFDVDSYRSRHSNNNSDNKSLPKHKSKSPKNSEVVRPKKNRKTESNRKINNKISDN